MVEIKLYPKYKEFEHFLDLYPPYLSNQGLPEWYKTQTKKNIRLDNLVKTEEFVDVKNVTTPAKFCPAIQEHITGGIIIPSWSDIYIVKNNEEVYWEVPAGRLTEVPNDFMWIEEHGYKQVDMMNLNVIPNHLGVFKLVCPYYFETNEGYGLEFSDVMYHIRHNVKFLSGRVETDKWHETNFPFEFYEDISKYEKKTLYIKAGDPLVMVRPYKIENEKINLSLEKYSSNMYRQQEKNQTLKSSVSHNWKRYKKDYDK